MKKSMIRNAVADDVPLIFGFVQELARYEKAENEVVATQAMIAESLFGPAANAHAVICEQDGKAIGFAVYFFNYSTWLGRRGLYLEDLFITPAGRGRGAGKALLVHLAQIALAEGCGRFEWSVLDWNMPAIRFYKSLGAAPQSEWTVYRLAGERLRQVAEGN